MPNLPLQFVRATQTGVYHLAGAFGFQQFNYSLTTKRWVPAAAGLAADQLISLLQDAALRRCATKLAVPHSWEGWDAEWAAAIADLHREYFEEYKRWCNKLQLPDPESQQQAAQQQSSQQQSHGRRQPTAEYKVPLMLLELALQFLIYTEAANLRHTPHLLFLIYYIMRGSKAFQQALGNYTRPAGSTPPNSPSTGPYTHWRDWIHDSAGNFGNTPSGYDITSLRLNLLQQMYDADPGVFHYLDPLAPTVYPQTQPLQDAVEGIVGVSPDTKENPYLQKLTRKVLQELQDIFKNGSQQVFLNHVVQPLFYFLAEQMDLAGHQGGEEAALRIAYCDVDEACCSPTGVVKMLDALKQEGWERMSLMRSNHNRDLWNALLQVMQPLLRQEDDALHAETQEISRRKALLDKVRQRTKEVQGGVQDRYPREPHRVAVLENLKILLQRRDGRGLEVAAEDPEAERAKALKHVTAKCEPALTNESEAISTVYQRAKYGAAWWSNNLFKSKTFVEARSVAAPFVAFWRVYTFHAVLFTAMLAVSFVLNKTGGIFQRTAPVDGWQLMAGLALSTVTDSLMRVLREAAYLVLYSYNIPVVRKQVTLGEEEKPRWCKIDPFPSGNWLRALRKALKLTAWLAWTAFLALCVLPVLLDVSLTAVPGLARVLHAGHWWLLPAAIHAVGLWGGSALRQKSGYTISWTGVMHEWFETVNRWRKRHRPRADRESSRWQRFAGHAECASDSKIDALFYPSKYLKTDKTRSWTNRVLWVVVILVKIAFEFFLILQPLMLVILELQRVNDSRDIAKVEFDSDRSNVNYVFNSIVMWLQIVAVSVPAALISLSDTGLIFSVAGGVLSGIVGFYRGVGSIKTWPEMVNNFNIILDSYKKHCVSRSALMLHLHGSKDNVGLALDQMSMSALAAGWNAMVYDLRQRDLLSNKELACIAFEHLVLDERTRREVKARGLTDVLPARCFVAGAVPELASAEAGSDHQLYVAGLTWQWFCWLLEKCKFIDAVDRDGLLLFRLPHPAPSRDQAHRRQELLNEVLRFIKLLSTSSSSPSNIKSAVAAASAGDVYASSDAAAAVVRGTKHTGMLHTDVLADDSQLLTKYQELLITLESLLKCLRQEVHEMGLLLHNGPSSLRTSADKSKIETVLNRLEDEWASWLKPEATAENLRSLQPKQRAKQSQDINREQRGLLAQTVKSANTKREHAMKDADKGRKVLEDLLKVGRTVPAVAQVAGWLLDALTHSLGDTIPSDDEAVRFIVGFTASLNDHNLKVAPSLQVMPSLTTLTPHYSEDVIYALNESDAWAEIHKYNKNLSAEKGFRFDLPVDSVKLENRSQVLYLMKADDTPSATMTYLRSVYCRQDGSVPSQWDNFVERVKGLAAADGKDVKALPARVNEFHFLKGELLHDYKEELLLWASCRGQLLARTVRGMMTYRTALAALADYENPRCSTSTSSQQHSGASSSSPHSSGSSSGSSGGGVWQPEAVRTAILEDLLDHKFSYVVSSQNLGEFGSIIKSDLKAAWLVHSIRTLMRRHPALKVAFIDKAPLVIASRPPGVKVVIRRDCSVLLCSVRQQEVSKAVGMYVATDEPQREAYRVQLPINFESGNGVIIGEGKPENQNHAIIFCHTEAVQTIDCNQDNLVAEGLKIRNLLAEFLPEGWDQTQPGWRGFVSRIRMSLPTITGRAPGAHRTVGRSLSNTELLDEIPIGKGRVALVGFREWVFSEDSGALAEFAAATEKSFGTTVQRLMHWPGASRFHYGHPDVWRRSFIATLGGVSKANKGLHVSEDVFGGYNTMLRGRDIKYVDYIAVGKGRDMSMETICMFEAKIASGNGEQVLSREVRRLGHSMDFTRLLTWYHTGNGFFINTAITMLSVHATVWVMLLMSFLQENNTVIQNWISAVQLLQLGTLSIAVYWITLVLDAGLFYSVWIIIKQVLQGSLMFCIFRAQTSAYSFTQDLFFGGAKYLATGRGYKLQHTKFKDLWQRFGRSHMYFGAVLTIYCLAIIAAKSHNGRVTGLGGAILTIWAPILVVISLLFGPFWFTPFAFRTEVVQRDMDETQQWFLSPSLKDSWRSWNKTFTDVYSDANKKQMGRFATSIRAHLMKLPTVLMLIAVTYRLDLRSDSYISKAVVIIIIAAGILILMSVIRASNYYASKYAFKYQAPRIIQLSAYILLIGGIISSGFATSGDASELGNAPLVFFSMFILLRLLPLFFYNPLLRRWFADLANAVYFAADVAIAAILECCLFGLSVFDILTGIQAQLLFNTSYAKQVISDSAMEQSEVPKLLTRALKLNREQR